MGPQDDFFYVEPWEDVRLRNFFLALGCLILFIVAVYIMWSCFCKEDDEEVIFCRSPRITPYNPGQKYPITPVYARELESGLVVLQSQDGEFFRILQECDAANYNKNGADSSTAQRSSSPNTCAEIPVTSSNVQYIPHYTRPFYQNLPSAPHEEIRDVELIDLQAPSANVPPPYSP